MMSGEGLRVLLAMQESSTCEHLLAELPKRGFPISIVVTNFTQARAKLLSSGDYYHAILLDDCLASVEAPEDLYEFIGLVNQRCPGTEIILLSKDTRQHVIPALQAGASLYLLKPVDAVEVAALLCRIKQHRKLRREGRYKQLLAELLATNYPLSSGSDEQETLECVLSGIRHIGFDRVRLYLLTGDRKYLHGKAQVGMKGNDFVGVSWPVTDDEYLQELIADPRPRVFECEPGKPTHPEDRLDKQGLKEWLCVPLVRNNEVIGLISADNKYCRRPIVEQEMAPLGLFATQGAVLTFNRQAEEIFGFSRDEALGAKVRQLYEDQFEPRHIGELLDQNNGKITDYKTNIRSKSGQIIPIHLTARWMHDEQGNLIGSVGFFENLRPLYQAQKRLELILRASNVLAQAQNLTEGLQSLAEMMVSLFPNAFCRILLYEERDATLTVQASYPLARSEQFGCRWEPGIGSLVRVSEYAGLAQLLQKGRPDIIKFSNDRQRANLEKLSYRLALEHPVQSLLLIPLAREDNLVGLLYLGELCGEQHSQFTQENMTLVSAIAAQITVLIEHRRLLEMAERRKSLLSELATVIEHITAEQDVQRLHHGLARGLAQLTGCDAGGLALNRPSLRQLEVKATFGPDGLAVGQRVCADRGLLSWIAQTGRTEIRRGDEQIVADDELLATQNFKTVIAVPLKTSSGEVKAVLFAGDRTGQCQFTINDLGILERFATNAALALQNASLIKSEQKRRDHLSLLDQIHKFIQEAIDKDKVLDAVLTAITLGYGLQLNRALVLLLDDTRRKLIGAAGIGQLDEDEAHDVWEKQRCLELPDFAKYLDELKGSGITLTTVGRMARDLRFTLEEDSAATQLFADVLQNHECKRIQPGQFSQLPPDLLEKFQPTSELVIVPLVTKNQGIGVLIVDNKFNRSPIKESDIESLISLANTAAVAIDNIDLLDSFYTFSNNLSSYQSLDELREAIGQAMWLATGASWVGLIIIDEQGYATAPLTYPKDYLSAALAMPRLDGISMSVLKTGQARTFPYTDKEREKLHPEFPPTIKAAACLPLCLPDKRIGVMWIHYEQPHHFTEFELGVLQLFVNHVANAYEAAQRIERFEKRRVAYESLALCNGSREVIKQIMESARHFLHANFAVFWFYDDKGGEFLIGNSEASGVSDADWLKHKKNVPRRGGTAHQALKLPYLLLRDVEDQRQRQHIGQRTLQLIADVGGRGLLGLPLKACHYPNFCTKRMSHFQPAEQAAE